MHILVFLLIGVFAIVHSGCGNAPVRSAGATAKSEKKEKVVLKKQQPYRRDRREDSLGSNGASSDKSSEEDKSNEEETSSGWFSRLGEMFGGGDSKKGSTDRAVPVEPSRLTKVGRYVKSFWNNEAPDQKETVASKEVVDAPKKTPKGVQETDQPNMAILEEEETDPPNTVVKEKVAADPPNTIVKEEAAVEKNHEEEKKQTEGGLFKFLSNLTTGKSGNVAEEPHTEEPIKEGNGDADGEGDENETGESKKQGFFSKFWKTVGISKSEQPPETVQKNNGDPPLTLPAVENHGDPPPEEKNSQSLDWEQNRVNSETANTRVGLFTRIFGNDNKSASLGYNPRPSGEELELQPLKKSPSTTTTTQPNLPPVDPNTGVGNENHSD